MDIAVLPTLYICAIVTGALLANCSRRGRIDELEQEVDSLQWDLAAARKKLDDFTRQYSETNSDADEE